MYSSRYFTIKQENKSEGIKLTKIGCICCRSCHYSKVLWKIKHCFNLMFACYIIMLHWFSFFFISLADYWFSFFFWPILKGESNYPVGTIPTLHLFMEFGYKKRFRIFKELGMIWLLILIYIFIHFFKNQNLLNHFLFNSKKHFILETIKNKLPVRSYLMSSFYLKETGFFV